MNRKILLLHSQGMFDHNRRTYLLHHTIKFRLNREYPPEPLGLVEFKHFKIGIYCLGVMYAVATMILIVEIIGGKILKTVARKKNGRAKVIEVESGGEGNNDAAHLGNENIEDGTIVG